MGLLDWLSDSLGDSFGGDSSAQAGAALSNNMGANSPPMPPVQQTGDDQASLNPPQPNPGAMARPPAPVDPSTSDLGGGLPPGGTGAPDAFAGNNTSTVIPPGAGSVPMPQPRPAAAGGMPPLPPRAANANASVPPPPPPGTPLDITPQAIAQNTPVGPGPQAHGILGRMIGLDPNTEAQLRGSLGSGLKSVAANWNKPGLAAMAGSAGASIEGGKTATDKTTAQQDQFLKDQLGVYKANDDHQLNVARTQRALAEAKAAMADSKTSVMNSDQQLYLRGLNAVHQQTLASASNLRAIQQAYGPDSPQAKAAQAQHDALVENTKQTIFGTLGISEKKAAQLGKQSGLSPDNPIDVKGLNQQKLDSLPAGAYIRTPDGKVLRKKATTGANPPAAAQSPQSQPAATPATPPMPPTAVPQSPASGPASQEDEE